MEQAGFRNGISTKENLHTLRLIILKCIEYNVLLALHPVDYNKAFNSIEFWVIVQGMNNERIDTIYRDVLKL